MSPEDTALVEQLKRHLFEVIPFNAAVIDADFNLRIANDNFEEYFGKWRGRKCYEVYKGISEPCAHCQAIHTFRDGRVRVSDETGIDRHGRDCHYVVHHAPLYDNSGNVQYVIEMSTDVTETKRWQRQYNVLFDRVPCMITVIDRNYHITRANEKFRTTFGDALGDFCYRAYRHRRSPCKDCPAAKTFIDGQEHVSTLVGINREGEKTHYQVTTSPLSRGENGVAHVIEICTDITELQKLQEELRQSHHYYESLIRNAADGILVCDPECNVQIINPAARTLLELGNRKKLDRESLKKLLPREFFERLPENQPCEPETFVKTASGDPVPVNLRAIELKSRRKMIGRAAFIRDLREVKRLEKEKLDAERLGAVGQTVAGLAHTIKNLLMGLEGGMYMVDSGLKRADAARITEGWEILQRNFNKTTALVKDFLSFAKGRLPELKLIDPNELAKDICELYRDAARQQGVLLELEADPQIKPALLDYDGMQACLTNLVSNGIDAAILGKAEEKRVLIRTREDGHDLLFEVEDNGCGMDMEVKKRVFTTFFTTKGGKGTGLGLLTTRKIVQEHGGKIEMDSAEGSGTIFRIRLPRERLNDLRQEMGLRERKGEL